MIGELINHYRVQQLLGRGAMGVVYKALDVNIDRPVAIKVMSIEARNDPAFVERFRQEARMQGALNHPNIALLFDYFIHNDAPVAVMEFIDGESLDQLIRRRGAIPAHESIPIFKQALLGVAAAHRAGIIHRDLKAANLMVTRDGRVKVMDFGVAKRPGAVDATKASTSVGSPLCMAPEQILGRNVDVRTDVYALGVTLYQILTGQPPFNPRGKSEYSVLNSHVNDLPEPPTVHRRDIPKPIVNAVMRAIAKEPEARFQSVEEFMRALPDVPAPPRNASPEGSPRPVAAAQTGPTGTMVLPQPITNGTSATPTNASSTRREPSSDTVMFDYSPRTASQTYSTPTDAPVAVSPSAVQELHETRRGFIARAPMTRPALLGLLASTFLLGALLRYRDPVMAMLMGPSLTYGDAAFGPAQQLAALNSAASSQNQIPRKPALTQAQLSMQPQAVAQMQAVVQAQAVAPARARVFAPEAPTPDTAPARQDLSGVWHGEYLDASGRPLLRVVTLRIRHVRDDGGIEGTLRYQAASGTGECQLLPGGSTYSADEQRLQLSPEGCSPHYPKELGVPLDFDQVNPHSNSLGDGRIEAPTGDVIRVKLRRGS